MIFNSEVVFMLLASTVCVIVVVSIWQLITRALGRRRMLQIARLDEIVYTIEKHGEDVTCAHVVGDTILVCKGRNNSMRTRNAERAMDYAMAKRF